MQHRAGAGFPDGRASSTARRKSPRPTRPAAAACYVRARTHFEDDRQAAIAQAIIITELPYQVNKARLIERIADLVRDKNIDGISRAARRVRQGRHARRHRAEARRSRRRSC